MVSGKVTVKNASGLHLRPAGNLCQQAIRFKSRIMFHEEGQSLYNAKSVLSVLGACIRCGTEIEIICEGEDEDEALKTLIAAIEAGLGEQEPGRNE